MSINFRVRAYPPEGEDLILEHFEARSDAEAYFKELQRDDEDNDLGSCGYPCVILELGEFVNGVWTAAARKLIRVD